MGNQISNYKICQGEASETIYWFEIISERKWADEDETSIQILMDECSELLAIFTSISQTARNN